jgi:hypothetical protein
MPELLPVVSDWTALSSGREQTASNSTATPPHASPRRTWGALGLFWSLSLVLFGASCSDDPTTASGAPSVATEHWPAYSPDSAWQAAVSLARLKYLFYGNTYQTNLQDYSSSGDYLNLSLTDFWRDIPGVERLDATGVPMINYDGTFYYNPVTVAEFALSQHGKFLRGIEPDLTRFWAGVARLLELQEADGSFQYVFDFPYYLNAGYFHAPWTSGMAQGMALSVFYRAWKLTGDSTYIAAGDRAFNFLIKPVSAGGVTQDLRFLDPSLSRWIIVDEYPALPSAYTLNGFMFALLGVYDWSNLNPLGQSAVAQVYFARYLATLDRILPYYDVGGFSAYDLGHIVYSSQPNLDPDYHATHIYLLHALGSVTQDPVLAQYEDLWRSYVPK